MPPKKSATAAADPTFYDEGFTKLLDDLKSEYGTRFEAHGVRFDKLEKALRDAKSEITALQEALATKEKEVTSIRQKANDQEQ